MTIIQAILLGVIQGLTEFLPISSTAHLTLAGRFLGLIDPSHPEEWTAFIAIIQLGTIAAVLVYFARDLRDLLRGVASDLFDARRGGAGRTWGAQSRLAGQIAVGTIPVVVLGLAFKKMIEGAVTKEVPVIATSLIVLALILWWAERRASHTRTLGESTWKDGLVIGLAQSLALIPGASRSGTTITAALLAGFERSAAARFSFLLSIPAVLASGVYQLAKSYEHIDALESVNLLVATAVAAVVGYGAIAFLLRYLRSHSTMVFIWYRILLGLALWGMVLARML
jgi:undecaprenyl-diphosphatase